MKPRGAQPRPASAPPSHLPAQSTPFVGRWPELTEVAERLANPGCRLLTLIGPGGIGKTRLALQVAAGQVQAFAHGVHFVPLGPIGSPEYLVSAIAESLEFPFYGGEDAKAQLLNYLRDRQMLLLLDNFEHLLGGTELLGEILTAASGLKFLVTSQERLRLQSEWLVEVQGMNFPADGGVGPVDADGYSAIQLFVQSAQRVDASFRLGLDNRAAVIGICQMVSGMPLGIEIASAWVRSLSCDEIAREISRNLGFLTTSLRDVPERHRSLQAVFDYSWNRLPDDERSVFRKLSIFGGGFQREAAELVAAASLQHLSALVDKSLLRRNANGRYEMHGLLRKYAQAKLVESGEGDVVRGRHLDFYLTLAEAAEPGLRRAEQLAWLARLETEHDNMRAALKASLVSGATTAGLRLAGALARFWYLRGYWSEGRSWLEKLLAQDASCAAGTEAEVCAKSARAKALYGAAWLANEGEAEAPLYQESLALCREVRDQWGVALSLRGLGARAINHGERDKAAALLDESLAVFRELDDAWGVALALFNQGWLAYDQDDLERAVQHEQQALDLFRGAGDRWGTAVALGALGFLARLQTDYQRAAGLSEASLALFRELGDKAGIATSLSRLGQVAFRRSSYPQATALMSESLALQRELGYQWDSLFSLSLLGLMACYQGDYQRATILLEEGLAIGQQVGAKADYAFLLDNLAQVAHDQGDMARAMALWQESLTLHRQQGDQAGTAYALVGLGLAAHGLGDQLQATSLLEEGLALYREVGDKRYIAIASRALGRAVHAQGDPARALVLFKESLALRKHMGDQHGVAESLEGVAAVAVTHGHSEKAARLFGIAAALREAVGAPIPPVERGEVERCVAAARAALGEAAFAAAWSAGQAMTLEQALAWAKE